MAGFPRRRAFAVATIGVAILLLGIATVVGVSVARTERVPSPLTAEIDERYRFDDASGVMPVALRNNGDEPVAVTRLELIAPSVVTEPAVGEIILRPGWTRRIRLELKPSRCPDNGAASSGPAFVVMAVTPSGGGTRELRLRAPDPHDVLGEFARADCAVQRVRRVADFALGAQWRRATEDGQPVLRGDLVVTRRAARPQLSVTAVRGSIIFELHPASDPPWRLAAGKARLTIPVAVEVSRCDLHALIESKKTFVFPVWVQLPGEAEQYLEVRADDRVKDRFYRLIDETCQNGTP